MPYKELERNAAKVARCVLGRVATGNSRCLSDDEGAQHIADALKINTGLQYLDLEANQISNEGAKAFAAALAINTALIDLELTNNQINQEGAKLIAASPTQCDVSLEFL